ncbi:MAG: MurR/RpiR family transcriptional regulator [Pseudomonadota bacterium]
MDDTNVSQSADDSGSILGRLSDEWDALTPEARKAARYVLDNPLDVGVSTVREIAEAANVKPNTFVRMARQVGFDGYDDFREPFRAAIRQGSAGFPDRARWLQDRRKAGGMGALYADMVQGALTNIEETFAGIDEADLKAAADTIWKCRNVYTLGVGVNNANARNFTYLASTGMIQFSAIPGQGTTAADDLAWAGPKDVLLAMTMMPYRREVLEAVDVARDQGLTIVAISDSPASPVNRVADHGFTVAVDTPQFFPSSVATIALLETLLSFVIAVASPEIVARVQAFHDRRRQLGLYAEDIS